MHECDAATSHHVIYQSLLLDTYVGM